MVKRKRVPLQLNGTDEQYFRTKEITGQPSEPAVPKDEVKIVDKVVSPKPIQKRQKSKNPPIKKVPVPLEASSGEIISRIIHLGVPLTKRLHEIAETSSVPIDDLLYAARKKTIKRFRNILGQSKKPIIEQHVKGGETLRIAISLSVAEMDQLKHWFDPLDIGLATKTVSPIVTSAFRAEVKLICDSVV